MAIVERSGAMRKKGGVEADIEGRTPHMLLWVPSPSKFLQFLALMHLLYKRTACIIQSIYDKKIILRRFSS